jgi:hypothetical protein
MEVVVSGGMVAMTFKSYGEYNVVRIPVDLRRERTCPDVRTLLHFDETLASETDNLQIIFLWTPLSLEIRILACFKCL